MPGLLQAASQVRWQDVVDVVILTLALIKAYSWLRGTVAFQVALGMLTLVAAALAARAAGLLLTSYVLQAVGAVAVLIAVVIFREEIRRALGRASPLRWWRQRRGAAERPTSDHSALAAGLFLLAHKRIGALVVRVRHDGVHDHLTGGTAIDALVGPEILEAIFQHGSPLHDGAAVVDGVRVRLAGAFLPLSRSPDLPAELGTRHRAAVGLTEACDALALAVSEERGEVSLAAGGRIEKSASAAALALRLDELTRARGDTRPIVLRPRGGLVRETLVRIAIVAGVLGAWYAVAGQRGSVITREVPVELVHVPAGLAFAPPAPGAVTLQLRGARRPLLSLAPADLAASVDLSGARPGMNELAVSCRAPAGIDVVRVVPPRVELEVLERRVLPISAQLADGFPRAMRVRDVVPREVTVVGKAGAFRGVEAIRTRSIAPDAVKDGQARVELELRGGLQLADERQREALVLFQSASTAAK